MVQAKKNALFFYFNHDQWVKIYRDWWKLQLCFDQNMWNRRVHLDTCFSLRWWDDWFWYLATFHDIYFYFIISLDCLYQHIKPNTYTQSTKKNTRLKESKIIGTIRIKRGSHVTLLLYDDGCQCCHGLTTFEFFRYLYFDSFWSTQLIFKFFNFN